MFSVLPYPTGTMKYTFRGHRLVVLPDYQGLGIGTKLQEFIGDIYLKNGDKLLLRTSHVRLIRHCLSSNKWKSTTTSGRVRKDHDQKGEMSGSKVDTTRLCQSFEYVGEDFNSLPHQTIVCYGKCGDKLARHSILDMIDPDKFPIIVCGVANMNEITIWETVARDLGLRTSVLKIKKKDEYYINKSAIGKEYDMITTSTDKKEKDIQELFQNASLKTEICC